MRVFAKWGFNKKHIPPEARREQRNLASISQVRWLNKNLDPREHCYNPVCLVTGDGATLPSEVKEFESWGIPHDLFCVNKSLLFFQRPVNHWTAIDAEESMWFAENLNRAVMPEKGRLLRHTIGICTNGYDVFWEAVEQMENEYQRRLWVGNSGYFGLLAALTMGYEYVILAGIPLDRNRCWYEAADEIGPHWVPETYTTWMDFKMTRPEADRARSMGGYSAFILGRATKEWVDGKKTLAVDFLRPVSGKLCSA